MIHRADVEAATDGPVTSFDASFAQDGLGEIVSALATERAFAVARTGRLPFEATDGPAWRVTLGGERSVIASGDVAGTDADAVVRGSSDQLCRWARPPLKRPVTLGLVALWRAVRVK